MRSIAIVLRREEGNAAPPLRTARHPLRASRAAALPLEPILAGSERYFVLDSMVGNVALRLCFPARAPQLLSGADIAASFQQYLEADCLCFTAAENALPAYVLCTEAAGLSLSDAAISPEVLEIACRGALSALFFSSGRDPALLYDPGYPASDPEAGLPEGILEYAALGESEADFALQESVFSLLRRLRRRAGPDTHFRTARGGGLFDLTEPL